MIIKWDGKDYPFVGGKTDVQEAITIKLYTGHGLVSWGKAIFDGDPQAVQALLWLIKKRNGETCEISSLNFDVMALINAYADAMVADKKPEDDAAPKADSASLPTSTSTPTSE